MKPAAIVTEPGGLVFREDHLHAHQGLVEMGRRRRKWNPSARVDAEIRKGYAAFVQGNDRGALKRVAERIGWPKHMVNKRGAELGLARVKEPCWSAAEVAILEANSYYGLEVIRKRLRAAGFHRSRTAILIKRKRLDLVHAGDGYSATALAELFGLDSHAVTGWIARGMLAAEKRGTDRVAAQGGDSYYIRHADVVAFVFAHADEVDLRKVEKWWFLDLVTGGAIAK